MYKISLLILILIIISFVALAGSIAISGWTIEDNQDSSQTVREYTQNRYQNLTVPGNLTVVGNLVNRKSLEVTNGSFTTTTLTTPQLLLSSQDSLTISGTELQQIPNLVNKTQTVVASANNLVYVENFGSLSTSSNLLLSVPLASQLSNSKFIASGTLPAYMSFANNSSSSHTLGSFKDQGSILQFPTGTSRWIIQTDIDYEITSTDIDTITAVSEVFATNTTCEYISLIQRTSETIIDSGTLHCGPVQGFFPMYGTLIDQTKIADPDTECNQIGVRIYFIVETGSTSPELSVTLNNIRIAANRII